MTPKQFRAQLYNDIATALVITTKSYDRIAEEFGCSNKTVYLIAKQRGIKRKRGPAKKQVS